MLKDLRAFQRLRRRNLGVCPLKEISGKSERKGVGFIFMVIPKGNYASRDLGTAMLQLWPQMDTAQE